MPWGRLDDSLYDHPKLDRLPLAERNACVGLWARAISWCNRFLTDGHVPRDRVTRLDGTVEQAELNVAAGLFDVTATGYAVHDFLQFNDSREQVNERREKEAQRKAEWRAKHRPGGTTNGTSRSAEADVPPGVPPSVPTGQDEDAPPSVPGFPARASRSAWRSANPGPNPTRPGPARPNESLEENRAPRRAAKERADVAALRAHGWKRVTKDQRAVLDEIADRHRREGNDGTWFAAEAIAAAGSTDPLKAATDADRMWQESQRRRVTAEDAARVEAKALEATPAPDWLVKATADIGS